MPRMEASTNRALVSPSSALTPSSAQRAMRAGPPGAHGVSSEVQS